MKFINSNQVSFSCKNKISCIYIVENIIEGKVYIGQTTNFRKRLSDYKNIHKKTYLTQPIAQAVLLYGTENFTIDILEFCKPDNLSSREAWYIKKYESNDPLHGYNYQSHTASSSNCESSRHKKSIGHIGIKEASETKRKKSNMILAVYENNSNLELIICDSGKLFGDFVGISKDMVKNCLRQPSMYHEYYLYYDNYEKRQNIRTKMMNKRSIRNHKYMDILNILDKIEIEGVETIDLYFDKIYILKYVDGKGYECSNYVITEE